MNMDAEPLLQITGVSQVANGRSILQDIDLAIAPGEVHALVGANGSGKTTLARLVMGAADLRPTAGSLRLGDEDLLPLPIHERARRGIAIAWQEPVTGYFAPT